MARLIFLFIFVLIAFSSCNENAGKLTDKLTSEYYSPLSVAEYSVDPGLIRKQIITFSKNDGITFPMDRKTRNYYTGDNPFIWINRIGIYDDADTLVCALKSVGDHGLRVDAFRVDRIEEDLERIKKLDFLDDAESINTVMARLEYNLTKAFFRYSAGLCYGFVNPDHLYNNLEKYGDDSVSTRFRQLCGLNVRRPNAAFYDKAVRKVANDSLSEFLKEVMPKGSLYEKLAVRLKKRHLTDDERIKTVCNMERCRWKTKAMPEPDSCMKRVVVNIPSYSLRALDRASGEELNLRIGCGTVEHKTPLLSSLIKRMDINPQWILPKSIAKDIVNNYSYMHKMGMFVYDKKSGKLPPEASSYSKIMSGDQYIIQAGGPKNSLGRIIFRFDNGFSVFLHDTSSPWLLQRDRRAISHGCVRVDRPAELALFLLGDKDEKTIEKLNYSMTMPFVNDNDSLVKQHIDRKKIINSLSVKPTVPLFITYYTVYYDNSDNLAEYDDIYGYDEPLIQKLSPIID